MFSSAKRKGVQDGAGRLAGGGGYATGRRHFRAVWVATGLLCAFTSTGCGGEGEVSGPTGPTPDAPASVELSPSRLRMEVGQVARLSAVVRDASGRVLEGRSVRFTSSDEGVAVADTAGLVMAVAQGLATIQARSGDAVASAPVEVVAPAVASVRIRSATGEAEVRVFETLQLHTVLYDEEGNELSGRTVAWASSNGAVASVDSAGLVRGMHAGTAMIEAASEGETALFPVQVVRAAAASVEVRPGSVTLAPDEQIRFAAIARDVMGNALSGLPVVWSSSNPAAASVDAAGTVTARSPGTATLSAVVDGVAGEGRVIVVASGPQRYAWPMPGEDGREWVINNYVDLDPSSGIRDYRGGTKSYNGHRGIDMDVPNFRAMDAGYPILAAAPGTVVNLRESAPDRNMSVDACSLPWNYVQVLHGDGTYAFYGHLKRNSVPVEVGDRVAVGDTLGVVGSSGCSSTPHLHFELRDTDGSVIDPFLEELWLDPPAYVSPFGLMDVMTRDGPYSDVDQLKDPQPDVESLSPGDALGIGVSVAGGVAGDRVSFTLTLPSGENAGQGTITFQEEHRHSWWYWNWAVANAPGEWTLSIFLNGSAAGERSFTVR